jgi:hypothetical protein
MALDDADQVPAAFRRPFRLGLYRKDGQRTQALETCGDPPVSIRNGLTQPRLLQGQKDADLTRGRIERPDEGRDQ